MFGLGIGLLACLAVAMGMIVFQDFKYRLVSLWVLLFFGIVCLLSVLIFRGPKTLLYNGMSCILYFLFTWLMLKLYLYLKYRKNRPVLNELLGPADVLVMLFIGLTFNSVGLILFFCLGFIFSLVTYFIYAALNKNKANEHIPLAGLLVFFYGLTIILLYLVKANYYVDCSFVNL